VLLLVGGAVAGELRGFDLHRITPASGYAFLYLFLCGSLIGFTAYVWLLQVSTPARVSTYAFVNPLIAVILGRVFLNEVLPKSALLAGALIVAAIGLITMRSGVENAPESKPSHSLT
jgi:drug/metabolite transporter (DMT)-like permease